MVSKTYIAKNLMAIEKLYNSTSSMKDGLFYSKLAVIELCGWIEMSMDDIVLRLSSKKLRDPKHIKYIERDIVKRTYGFDYENNFLPMVEAIIGRDGIEKMNSKLDNLIISPFVGALTALKASRNQLAHQYIKGTTLNIDAPSLTKNRFQLVLPGLKSIEKVLLK